ncbi:hypothetical protein Syun_018826 [Stephania yunnanensis]|uniref:Neprosin PEP catalytic domain-containing protein n=1 Tax=Stephania yunnanensis TaxID=152371 RepID=A0AAP0NWQ8_9MAGN
MHICMDLVCINLQEDGGNWLLIVQNETVGYWPKGLVPSLDDGASHLLWGGLTFGLTNEQPAPIGNGLYPSPDLYYTSAFLAHMNIVDQKGAVIKAPTNQLESILDNRESYGLYVVDENESSTLYGGEAETDCTS